MQLAQFDFRIKHRKGVSHGNADGLTRANKPVHEAEPFSLMGGIAHVEEMD